MVHSRRRFLASGLPMVTIASSACFAARGVSRNNQTAIHVKALTFDVFGTVVDWRTSIIREGALLNKAKGLKIDWPKLADAWRAGYRPAMNRVRTGDLPWTNLDGLHRLILDGLVGQFGLELASDEIESLNRVWHRLIPWPDSIVGLQRLRDRYIVSTLSNGNVSLLVNMAKHAGLPWDCVLSAEMSGTINPTWRFITRPRHCSASRRMKS